MTPEEIEKIIDPESSLEYRIISDPEFIEGANYGKPRDGHPEGEVIWHIKQVLANVDIYGTFNNRAELRLITILHDSMKYKVIRSKPRVGVNNHGYLARKFAEKYEIPENILEILELHDEAYNAWCKGSRDDNWEKARERLLALLKRLGKNIDLYVAFYICDNRVNGKKIDNMVWFDTLRKELTNGKKETKLKDEL